MLVYSILGFLYAAAIVFLLYAYRGFAQEQKRNRPTQGVVTELKGTSKEPPYSRRGLALLFFASPGLCLASLEAQTAPPAPLPLPAMVSPLSTAVPGSVRNTDTRISKQIFFRSRRVLLCSCFQYLSGRRIRPAWHNRHAISWSN